MTSVANLTRADGEAFLHAVTDVPLATAVHRYPLGDANRAIADLRAGRLNGAAVLLTAAGSASAASGSGSALSTREATGDWLSRLLVLVKRRAGCPGIVEHGRHIPGAAHEC